MLSRNINFFCILMNFIVLPVQAQDAKPKVETKKEQKTSDRITVVIPSGYSVYGPKGWVTMSKYLVNKNEVPEQARARYDPTAVDVIFVDPEAKVEELKYERNIILAIIPIDKDFGALNLEKFKKEVLIEQFGKVYSKYEIKRYGVVKIQGREVLDAEMRGEVNEMKIYQRQIFVPFKKDLILVNCVTVQEDIKTLDKACEDVAASVSFK